MDEKSSSPQGEKRVTVTIPVGVYDFCKNLTALDGTSVEDFFRQEIMRVTDAVIDELPRHWIDKEALRKKYRLGD